MKLYIDKYNWKEKFERNNTNIALDILYVPTNTKEMCKYAYRKKTTQNRI